MTEDELKQIEALVVEAIDNGQRHIDMPTPDVVKLIAEVRRLREALSKSIPLQQQQPSWLYATNLQQAQQAAEILGRRRRSPDRFKEPQEIQDEVLTEADLEDRRLWDSTVGDGIEEGKHDRDVI